MFLQVFVCLSLNITQKLLADFDEIFRIDHLGDVHFCLSVGDITPKVVDGFDDIFRMVWQCYKEFS